ncbi:hypothetical protein A0J61_03084 [Choanephora cucurbitarum]|uniref:Uncharacterized protein n=1 Tax=Choanephora cucurbitarum TaxID=101091 RepID=A0A1C7NK48_9FUNG|nr:hypothetical protein A0J61_03084 [Choanephora cucurbitarum]
MDLFCVTYSNIRANMHSVNTSYDDYLEDGEQEEMEIEHFSLSEEWMERIRRIGNDSLSYVHESMENSRQKAVASVTGINLRTAQNYVKAYNNDPERRLLGSYSKPRGRPHNKLTEEHSKFLVDYIEKNTTVISDELKLKLCEKFEGLKISISAIYKHLIYSIKIKLGNFDYNPLLGLSDQSNQ